MVLIQHLHLLFHLHLTYAQNVIVSLGHIFLSLNFMKQIFFFCFIIAIFSPNVTMQNQTVNTTTTVVVLGCSVEAHPKADIEWYKDGIRLDVKSRLLTQSNCRMSQNGYYFVVRNGKTQTQDLVICKVDFKKNSGTYTCKAVNSVGNGSASAWLQVDGNFIPLFSSIRP